MQEKRRIVLTSIVCIEEQFLKDPEVIYILTSEIYSCSGPKISTFSPIVNYC